MSLNGSEDFLHSCSNRVGACTRLSKQRAGVDERENGGLEGGGAL